MVVDQSRLDQANQSLDYYKQSYEELVSKVPEYRDKIENGGIDIESMTGDQKTNVENAMKAYDSYLDSQKNAKEIQKQLREDKSSYYEQIIEQATKENERLSSNNDLIQKQIDLLKARGNIVDASTYETMIGNTRTQIGNTKSVIKSRKKKLSAAMDEGLEVGDEEWYELTKSISDAEGELLDLEEQQAEYNKELKEMPITNMTTIINMYKDISTAIQNWGAELEASGTALTADYYQELIKNGSTIISEYKEQAGIIKDVMDTYDVGSDNWNELYSQLQNVKSDGPGKSAWSNKDENNGPGAEINRKKAGIAHSGLEAGVVGQNNEDSEEAWMKSMGLKELDPKEYPYILKAGEQVINEEQRHRLISNVDKGYGQAYTDGLKKGIEAMSKSGTQVNNTSYTVNAPIDKIVLQNVQDPDGFAKALYENLGLTMAQQRSKFKF